MRVAPLDEMKLAGSIAVEVTSDLAVDRIVPDIPHRTLVPRPGRQEAHSNDCLGVAGKQHVASNLLLYKPGVRLILVEGADDIIAIGPGICSHPVLVVP